MIEVSGGHKQANNFNSSATGQNDRHLADDIFSCISVNHDIVMLMKISLEFVPKGPTDNNPALV